MAELAGNFPANGAEQTRIISQYLEVISELTSRHPQAPATISGLHAVLDAEAERFRRESKRTAPLASDGPGVSIIEKIMTLALADPVTRSLLEEQETRANRRANLKEQFRIVGGLPPG